MSMLHLMRLMLLSMIKDNAVTVLVDGSGSAYDIWQIMSDITKDIVNHVDRYKVLVGCDNTTEQVNDIANIECPGGSFDVAPILHSLHNLNTCIILTDGLVSWPKYPPPFDVIIALIGEHVDTPYWATTIIVE